MSPGGRHGHKIRELKRRIDAVLEEERAARKPPPPPISSEHAAMRERIERGLAELERQLPDGKNRREALGEAVRENPDLGNDAAELVGLMRESKSTSPARAWTRGPGPGSGPHSRVAFVSEPRHRSEWRL